ncbi:MAG: hypothetical protein HKM93_16930 [Desulfobacteraceae bacterium]|nr:hypothetical protein [Desulfobacteraceae bacterium]
MRSVSLHIQKDFYTLFAQIFSKGVDLPMEDNRSIRDFLCLDIGIPDAYLDHRIQTVFMNGRPVDDVRAAMIGDGAVLALSAAMPGLVGATLRRGGHLAAMRKEITYENSTSSPPADAIRIRIKLFNLIAHELGPVFLNHGVQVSASDMVDVLTMFAKRFRQDCRSMELDGGEVSMENLVATLKTIDQIHLRVVEN